MFTIYSGFVMPKCRTFCGAYNSYAFLDDSFNTRSEFASNESSCFRFDMVGTLTWR